MFHTLFLFDSWNFNHLKIPSYYFTYIRINYYFYIVIGVYLPLLWDVSFCWRVPIALGYTRGHFSALVGMRQSCDGHVTYLPLVDCDLNPLPVMFVSDNEVSWERERERERESEVGKE